MSVKLFHVERGFGSFRRRLSLLTDLNVVKNEAQLPSKFERL